MFQYIHINPYCFFKYFSYINLYNIGFQIVFLSLFIVIAVILSLFFLCEKHISIMYSITNMCSYFNYFKTFVHIFTRLLILSH